MNGILTCEEQCGVHDMHAISVTYPFNSPDFLMLQKKLDKCSEITR